MTDPRQTDPRPERPSRDPNLRPSSAPMWAWIAGIAVVIVIAFALAAGWSGNTNTADNAPPATVGSGGTTMPPSTTGSGATGRAPAMSPDKPAAPASPKSDTK